MSADLDAACAKVGRYLYEFALLEREINASIVQIFFTGYGVCPSSSFSRMEFMWW